MHKDFIYMVWPWEVTSYGSAWEFPAHGDFNSAEGGKAYILQ